LNPADLMNVGWDMSHAAPSPDKRRRGVLWGLWLGLLAVIAFVANVTGIASFVMDFLQGRQPESLSEEDLRSALLILDDLPDDWENIGAPFGVEGLSADEFCGEKPTADPIMEVTATFGRVPLGLGGADVANPKAFSTVALFDPGGASRFLADLRALAESCEEDGWLFRPSAGADAIPQQISRLESAAYGQEALRIVVTGPPTPEIDFIYIRHDDLIAAVAYSVQDTPFSSGDEHADPVVTEDLAGRVSRRLAEVGS